MQPMAFAVIGRAEACPNFGEPATGEKGASSMKRARPVHVWHAPGLHTPLLARDMNTLKENLKLGLPYLPSQI